MERKTGFLKVLFMFAAVITFTLAAFTGPSLAGEKAADQMVEKASEKIISGTVVEVSKDKEGKVSCVGLQTSNKGEFTIAQSKKGAELMEMVDREVELTGAVKESEGKKTIEVTSYKVIE